MSRALARAALALLAVTLSACPSRTVQRQPDPLPPAHAEPELVGKTHVVKPGETLWRISRMYGVEVSELTLANGISDVTQLEAGRTLFIPGAPEPAKSPPKPKVEPEEVRPVVASGDSRLGWPLIGVLYAKFGIRGETQHDGIDISAPEGSLVRSAGDGTVIYSGEQRGYGNIVIVQHAGDLITLYAQNKENLVREGAKVKRGDPVARVGTYSRTSGPHLHFEVREGSTAKDPLDYLPPPQ